MKLFLIFFYIFTTAQAQAFKLISSSDFEVVQKKEVYGINAEILQKKIGKDQHHYKLIYTFTDWCKPCREMMPQIITFVNENKSTDSPYFVTDLRKERDEKYLSNYLYNINFEFPVYNILLESNIAERKGKYVKTNYDRFVQKLTNGHENYGYGLILLFDKSSNLLYKSTYLENHDQIIQKIKKLIN